MSSNFSLHDFGCMFHSFILSLSALSKIWKSKYEYVAAKLVKSAEAQSRFTIGCERESFDIGLY